MLANVLVVAITLIAAGASLRSIEANDRRTVRSGTPLHWDGVRARKLRSIFQCVCSLFVYALTTSEQLRPFISM